MGHKVSPVIFRVPYIKNWKSNWFSPEKNYSSDLLVDVKIRDILKTKLTGIPMGDVFISKNQENLYTIDIYTAKVSLVLGENNENVDSIKTIIENKLGVKVQINVKEVKKPELSAKLVSYFISNQIEKRMPYKRVIKQAIEKSMEKGAKGIKVKIGGRLNGAEIARKETFKDGNIPTQTIRADIDYSEARAETIYGTIGLKIWIYKGQIFKKK